MIGRWRLLCCLATALIGVGGARAADPEGRARTWEFGFAAGTSVLDGGFNSSILGYTVPFRAQDRPRTPIVEPDNLDTMVPTFGFRVGYSVTPWLTFELNTAMGSTVVGAESTVTAVANLELDPTPRTVDFKEQQQMIPGIYSALENIEYDVTTSSLMSQFNFRNRPEEKFVFYFSVGGGFASLNANTGDFNDCPTGPDVPVIIADDPALAGDQDGNGRVESPEQVDIFDFDPNFNSDPPIVENPAHIDSFIIDCGRVFPIARLVSESPDPDLFWIGKARFHAQTSPPGQLASSGQRTVNKINGVDLWTYAMGAGMRWHLKPRHVLRFDARRHFGESMNKDINEFTVGYGYILGQGKARGPAVPDVEGVPTDPAAPSPPPDPNAPPPDPSTRLATAAAAPTYSLVSGR